MMRWVFRFAVYFVKPVLIVGVIGHFGFLTLRAVANAVSSYEKAKVKEEIKARSRLDEIRLKESLKNKEKGRVDEQGAKDNRGH